MVWAWSSALRRRVGLENKLNAIFQRLKKGFDLNYKDVIVDTDNLDAFKVIKSFLHDVLEAVAKVDR